MDASIPDSSTAPAVGPDRAISAHNLSKTYTFYRQQPGFRGALRSLVNRQSESRLAVDAVSFTIASGEVVGLLGPNGAGKTTTLKMLTGLIHPSGGELDVLGHQPFQRDVAYLRQIAVVMGQKSMLWWDVPAMETFLLHKELYGLTDRAFRASVDDLSELLEVKDLLHVPVRKLSLGERMKMELVAALLHQPEVLFLDEPTIGLDVVAKARVREFLAEINRDRGTTILITSHDMDDIEALYERVMVINHGAIVFDGGLNHLVHSVQPRKLVKASYEQPIDPTALSALATVVSDTSEPSHVVALEVARDRLNHVLEILPRQGAMIDLEVTDAEIEDIIRELFLTQRTQEVAS